jgi:pimeloyl-ACP methyl ester carboxylesterase
VYVPRYRQATLWAFVDTTGNGTKALTLGLDDVERAFRYYIEHLNKGRPFILAGHSQGSYQLLRLLRERLTSEEDRDVLRRMVAAYLVGLPTQAGWLQEIPFCETPTQTGCWCTWNSFHASVKENHPSMSIFRQPMAVNPVTFRTHADTVGVAALPARVNLLYRYKPNPPETRVWVSDGIVRLSTRKPMNPKFLGGVDYHVLDYNLFFVPLQRNVEARIAAWYSRQQMRTP